MDNSTNLGLVGPGPLLRTVRKLASHLVQITSDIVGDDVFSKAIRRTVLRLAGAVIADDVHIHSRCHFSRPTNLTVGTGTFINRNCYFDLEGAVSIGRDVTIGHGSTFVTTGHNIGPSSKRAGAHWTAPVAVGDGVWIGANATVLPGVTIGRGAIVAAGALVRTNVAADTMVAGVPAVAKKHLEGEIDRRLPHRREA